MGQARINKLKREREAAVRKSSSITGFADVDKPTASRITINTDGITDEQKTTEKFNSAYREMMAELMRPGFIPVLCAHEAAHTIYFNQLGITEFEPLPPRLRYSPEIDDYVGHLAAMQNKGEMRMWEEGKFWDWFIIVACAHAAGGVVARKLMPSSDGGDQDDKDRFKKLCDKFNEDPKVKIDFDQWWEAGQKQVAEHLKAPEAMKAIEQRAERIRPLLGL